MEDTEKKKVCDALFKRAIGYDAIETVEEFVIDDEYGEARLTKRKVTTKNVPPDISAAKLLLGISSGDSPDVSEMSDDELETEKQRLVGIIRTEYAEEIN